MKSDILDYLKMKVQMIKNGSNIEIFNVLMLETVKIAYMMLDFGFFSIERKEKVSKKD